MHLICPSCQTSNAPKARFCRQCGQPLASVTAGESAPTTAPANSPTVGSWMAAPTSLAQPDADAAQPTQPLAPETRPADAANVPAWMAAPTIPATSPAAGPTTPAVPSASPPNLPAWMGAPTQPATTPSTAPIPARAVPPPPTPAPALSPETPAIPPAPPVSPRAAYPAENQSQPGRTVSSPEQPSAPPALPTEHAADDNAEVAFALNFHRVLVAGYGATFCLRIENRSALPLEQFEVTISSRALAQKLEWRTARLPAARTVAPLLDLEPSRAGNFVLHVAISYLQRGSRLSLTGTRGLCVNEVPSGTNIVANVSVLQSDQGGGANVGLGGTKNVSIGNLIDTDRIKTLNDLLNVVLPDSFIPVALTTEYELELSDETISAGRASAALTIPPPLLGTVQAGTVLVLTPRDGTPDARGLRLVARPQFTFGRSRQEADVPAWFWPRNKDNDERTMRLSKIQAILSLDAGRLVVRDPGSSNGTELDGQRLGTNQPAVLGPRAVLDLAGGFPVDLQRHEPTYPNGPLIGNLRGWAGPADTPPALRGSLEVRLPPHAAPLVDALWLFSDATFGASAACALTVAAPGLAEIQGRFHFHRGCFWVENAAPGTAVELAGLALRLGEIAPLATGQELRLGQWRYRVEVVK